MMDSKGDIRMKQGNVLWRRVIILALGLVSACVLFFMVGRAVTPKIRSCFLSLFMKEDPKYAAQVAHTMIDYDLPPGYQEQSAMQVKTYYNLAIIASNDHPSDLIAIQPASDLLMDSEWGESSLERAAQEIGDLRYQTHTVSVQDWVIRNQPSRVRILEGQDEDGIAIRQALSAFNGKNGNVLVIIVGDIETWDQAMVDQFLSSIH
jgi:hypothetical protein